MSASQEVKLSATQATGASSRLHSTTVLNRAAARPDGLHDVQALSNTADHLALNLLSLVSSRCTWVLSNPTPSAVLFTADADKDSPIGCNSVCHVSACWLTGQGFTHT